MNQTSKHIDAARSHNSQTSTKLGYLLEKVVPRRLKQIPQSVPESEFNIYRIRFAMPLIAAFSHVTLAILYGAIDVQWMAVINVFSVVWFLLAGLVILSGRHYLGCVLTALEPSLHVPLCTIVLGLDAGYLQFGALILAVMPLAFQGKSSRTGILFILLTVSYTTACIFWGFNHNPLVSLPSWKISIVNYVILATVFAGLIVVCAYVVQLGENAQNMLSKELQRSEKLLLNILPAPIVDRLKSDPGIIANDYKMASILFCDICDFTRLSTERSGSEVVRLLNTVFSKFDILVERYQLEKIKTIGDSYMVVAGVPTEDDRHAERMALLALDMLQSIEEFGQQTRINIQVRIGIHSGPVIAGVIGEKKFAYDLWGDAVNVASRMEALGKSGHIQISSETHKLLPDFFVVEKRGSVGIKGRKAIECYWLKGTSSSVDRNNLLQTVEDESTLPFPKAV